MNDVKAKYCFYCERPFGFPKISLGKPIKKTRDHIIPTSKGGLKSKINIVYACHICNGIKADRTLEQFRHYLQAQLGSSRKKIKADRIEIMIANIDKLIV